MASPQLQDGYTQIANEIMEALAKINLSPYESRVLWFILRKTYGWKKQQDWIASSQMRAGLGGLDRRNIFRAVRSLVDRNMIVICRDDKGKPKYSFQKDYSKWRVSSIKMTGDHKRHLYRHMVSSVETHTKETLTKESKRESDKLTPAILPHSKKDKHAAADPRVREFLDWWAAEYEIRFRAKYVFHGAKEGALIKHLPMDYDILKLKELGRRFFETDDEWIKQRGGYTVGVFISQLNKLTSTANGTGAAKPTEVRDLGEGWFEVDGLRISERDYNRRWKTA